MDAEGSRFTDKTCRERIASVRPGAGGLAVFCERVGQQGSSRDSGEGPVPEFLDLQQQPGTAVEGRRPEWTLPLHVRCGWIRPHHERLRNVGTHRKEVM